MLRRTFLALAAFALAAPLFAGENGDRWLLLNGEHAGTVIVTTAAGTTDVQPEDNGASQAQGSIGTKTTGNGGSIFVYHGTLFGDDDPKPNGIGWGRVVKVPAGASITGDFATASQKIESAIQVVAEGQIGCDAIDALSSLDAAAAALNALKAKIDVAVTQGGLPADMAKEHKKVLDDLLSQVGELHEFFVHISLVPAPTLEAFVADIKLLKKKHKKIKKTLKSLLDHLRDCGLIALN